MTTEPTTTPTKPARRRRPGGVVAWLRLYYQTLGRLLPGLASRQAYRLWFATRRFPPPPREAEWLAGSVATLIATPAGPVQAWRWGETGPRVLLVHGWNGRGSQLGAYVAPLLAAGYQVLAFDGPGHGHSPARATNLFELAAATQAVAEHHGPLEAIITHSFGSMVSSYALRRGLAARRLVSIAAPASLEFLLQRFADILAIPSGVQSRLRRRIEAEFGPAIWEETSSLTNAAALGHIPALILHDEDDAEVPAEQARHLHRAWPGSRLHPTRGLGHTRILRDADTVARAVRFLQECGGGR